MLDQIFSPLDMTIVQRERKMIKEELSGNLSDTTHLVNRIGKELYGKTFGWAQSRARISLETLQHEHQKYYHQDNLWITDDDFVILQRPKEVKEPIIFDRQENVAVKSYKVR